MKRVAAVGLFVTVLAAQTDRARESVVAVRHWSLPEATRIAVEVSGDFQYRTDRLHNPERIYFDVLDAKPRFADKRLWSEDLEDKLVKRIRVAETAPGVTRIVLDLDGAVGVSSSKLANPSRLIIELRAGAAPPIPTVPAPTLIPASPARTATVVAARTDTVAPPVVKADSALAPTRTAPPAVVRADLTPTETLAPAPFEKPMAAEPAPAPPPSKPVTPDESETAKAAHRTSDGGTSLVRALGLKISRVVIDPGHGGHDQGTTGVTGLLEKDLVLDVSLRVGKLIEEKLGAQVVYTRTDDSFVSLDRRVAMANEKKADLFLSIHANSSPVAGVSGTEVYYLNFTESREAIDLATRENASSQKSIFELHDIIQKITLHDKAEESREFAGDLQTALFALMTHNSPSPYNRGVKRAPFVVLIGANMPSVLAEIGFVTNSREEALLKRPDYRQKLAEALFRGLARYADSLSHFQVARNQ